MSIRPCDRFLVFRRDNFTCQYCGRKAPEAVLECDHVLARANGGGDDLDNLLTACRTCNIGKGTHDAFNQHIGTGGPERRRIPRQLRKTWHGTGRCAECGTSVNENDVYLDTHEGYCLDCAEARESRGLCP